MSTNRRGTKVKTPGYGAWADMIQRCNNPNLKYYANYGGRGIRVCDRWKSFDNFHDDMGDKPKGYTLGRINNDGNYELSNCEWQTVKQQSLNKTTTRFIEWDNRNLSVTEWSEIVGISRITIATRLNRGWSVREALTLKPLARGRSR